MFSGLLIIPHYLNECGVRSVDRLFILCSLITTYLVPVTYLSCFAEIKYLPTLYELSSAQVTVMPLYPELQERYGIILNNQTDVRSTQRTHYQRQTTPQGSTYVVISRLLEVNRGRCVDRPSIWKHVKRLRLRHYLCF